MYLCTTMMSEFIALRPGGRDRLLWATKVQPKDVLGCIIFSLWSPLMELTADDLLITDEHIHLFIFLQDALLK